MRADVDDLVAGRREQSDVDPALVVAVDDHDLAIRRPADLLEHDRGEVAQRDAVLGFDHAEDLGVDVAHDHRRVAGGQLVDGLGLELDPADPVEAAGGDDVDAAVVVAGQEAAAVLAQDRVLTAVVSAEQPELAEEVQDLRDDGRRVGRLVEQLVDTGLLLEDDLAVGPGGQRERLGTVEQVLDVVGRDPQHGGPLR
jgi:hypothetical protein